MCAPPRLCALCSVRGLGFSVASCGLPDLSGSIKVTRLRWLIIAISFFRRTPLPPALSSLSRPVLLLMGLQIRQHCTDSERLLHSGSLKLCLVEEEGEVQSYPFSLSLCPPSPLSFSLSSSLSLSPLHRGHADKSLVLHSGPFGASHLQGCPDCTKIVNTLGKRGFSRIKES